MNQNIAMDPSSSASQNHKNFHGNPKGKKAKKFNEKEITNQFERQLNLGKKGKKNQISLNHLLHYESYRESDEYKTRQATKPKNRSRTSRGSFDYAPDKYKVPLTGMSFINLNYKFVVDYKGNYKPQELDPNVPVSRKDIIRIIAPKGNSCPICLSDEPIAPRMITACGHILCLKCLLSLLDTEIPSFKKKESSAVVEKYKECPLCTCIIRKKECKPVLINNIDERFETPKIGTDVIMTLMSRPHNKLFSVPRSIENVHYQIKNFPSVTNTPDLSSYSRLFKADLKYILDMYTEEKKQILQAYEEEKLLYDEDSKYTLMAIDEINKELDDWTNRYNEDSTECESIASNDNMNAGNSFFYYETGFNTNTTYVLSPLDIKVLKTNYNDDYGQLPSTIIVKIENIQYEELTPENSMKKYKYLSHLPLGTSIGFIQCNWFKNDFISQDTWSTFKADLSKRSKKTSQKFEREDRNQKRAQQEEERRTKMFFEQENHNFHNSSNHRSDNFTEEYYGASGGLTIVDNRELPSLLSKTENTDFEELDTEPSTSSQEFQTTVWGTKIRKTEEAVEEDLEAEEMIRKAREEMEKNQPSGKKKKKLKKLILLSSNNYL